MEHPVERHSNDVVKCHVVKRDDLMGDGRPEDRHRARLDHDPLATQKIREGSTIEEIDFNLVMPVRTRHLLGLPELAGKPIGREVRSLRVEMPHGLGIV